MSEQYFVDKELYDNLSANYSRAELEIERLNNIIDELEKWAEDYRFADILKNKLNELKGDNK